MELQVQVGIQLRGVLREMVTHFLKTSPIEHQVYLHPQTILGNEVDEAYRAEDGEDGIRYVGVHVFVDNDDPEPNAQIILHFYTTALDQEPDSVEPWEMTAIWTASLKDEAADKEMMLAITGALLDYLAEGTVPPDAITGDDYVYGTKL